jgi:threonine/homoserine/homoserine lactone efflux protein
MAVSLFVTYLFSVVLLLITPGPVVALVTHTALHQGYRSAFITVAGTNLASLLLMAVAVMLLSGVVSVHPLSLPLVGIAGSLYIGWLAAGMLLEGGTEGAVTPRQGGFGVGFFTAVANPDYSEQPEQISVFPGYCDRASVLWSAYQQRER